MRRPRDRAGCQYVGGVAATGGRARCSRWLQDLALRGLCEQAFASHHADALGVLLVSNALLLLWFGRRCCCCPRCCCGGRRVPSYDDEDGEPSYDGGHSPNGRSGAFNPDYPSEHDDFISEGQRRANAEVAKLVRTPGTTALAPSCCRGGGQQ